MKPVLLLCLLNYYLALEVNDSFRKHMDVLCDLNRAKINRVLALAQVRVEQ